MPAAPKPTKRTKSRKPRRVTRRDIEKELEALIRQIVWWRDAGICIEAEVDGVRCGGALGWGHFTPRRQSRWLKLTLGTFVQCANHNNLHDKGSQTMALAVGKLLGLGWIQQHEAERDAHRDGKVYISDLLERLDKYKSLWDNRPPVYTTEELIQLGYYG